MATDYERFVNTEALLACQRPLDALVNSHELFFQITHQVMELWMKAVTYELRVVIEALGAGDLSEATLPPAPHPRDRTRAGGSDGGDGDARAGRLPSDPHDARARQRAGVARLQRDRARGAGGVGGLRRAAARLGRDAARESTAIATRTRRSSR